MLKQAFRVHSSGLRANAAACGAPRAVFPEPRALNPQPWLRGFTLVETLIACSVLAFAVVALATPFSLAARQQRIDAISTTAATLAGTRMERLMTCTYVQLLDADDTVEVGKAITGFDGAVLNDATLANFTLSINVSEVPIPVGDEGVDEAARFAVVTVSVTHPEVPPVSIARMFAQ
jgi:type II secretory pathway pseudopilin PulG